MPISNAFHFSRRCLTEALLNAPRAPDSTNGTIRLFFGIEDTSLQPIGLLARWTPNRLDTHFLSALDSGIFPRLNMADFKLVMHRLIGTTMEEWNLSHHSDARVLTLSTEDAYRALLYVQGRAVVVPADPDDYCQVVVISRTQLEALQLLPDETNKP